MHRSASPERQRFEQAGTAVCFQKIVRDAMASRPEAQELFPAPADLSLKRARVREVSRAIAWKIIARYEWLGTLPPCNRYFGLFFDDVCGGVACYSVGSIGASGDHTAKFLGVQQREIAYLARGACVHWAPKGSAPKLINFSARLTGAQVAIAYSDTEAGEIGTVYQAAGWSCLGRTTGGGFLVSPEGRKYNHVLPRDLARQHGGTYDYWRKRLIDAGWTPEKPNPKIRYAMILPRGQKVQALLERFKASAQKYPKRGDSLHGETSGPQPEEGGSIPTSPLEEEV